MKIILDKQFALAKAHGPRWATDRVSLLRAMVTFAVLMLSPLAFGVCPCTMFDLVSLIAVAGAALLVGNNAITALAEEREKKTLVFLRLTLLSAPQVMLLKLIPELLILRAIFLITAPVILAASILGGVGLVPALTVMAFTVLSGAFAAFSALLLSTMFPGTSKAVVGGWIFKAVWLLLTPVLDLIVAAVFVQTSWPPVFSSLNPLMALASLRVPEAFTETQRLMPGLFVCAVPLAILLMFRLAAWRFDAGFIVGQVIGDEQAHPVYQQGWGPGWLQSMLPALKENAMFLRELASQMRLGAGRRPGYAVFVVLFLAPFLYARMWADKDAQQQMNNPVPQKAVVMSSENNGPTKSVEPEHVDLMAQGVRFRLVGHTHFLCLRLILNEMCDVPLPQDQLQKEVYAVQNDNATRYQPVGADDPTTQGATNNGPIQPIGAPRVSEVPTSASLNLGLAGAVVLLLLYLGIRCSGFLAGAITGERDRRAWEDLALTALRPSEAFGGKVLGALLLPLLQMTLTFPLMLFFVVSGNLSGAEVGGLYVYAMLVAVGAGMLGLWASAYANTSHEAHARALLVAAVTWVLLPLVFSTGAGYLAVPLLAIAMVRLARQRSAEAVGWAGMGLMLLVNPFALSPLTAVLSFMPSLQHAGGLLSWFGVAQMDPLAAFVTSGVFMLSAIFLLWTTAVARTSETGADDALKAIFDPREEARVC